jgi:hypothetical protein
LQEAETDPTLIGAKTAGPFERIFCLDNQKPKMQGEWGKAVSTHNRNLLLQEVNEDGRLALRGCGGTGASTWLLPRQEGDPIIPDAHYAASLKMRFGLDVCAPGALCQHKKKSDGSLCNQLLDAKGWHARKCGTGSSRDARHNAMRDWHAPKHTELTGYAATTEKRVPAWDRFDARTGELEEARLDVATRDATTGNPIFVDWSITCEHSNYEPRRRARSNKDGLAATQMVSEKRSRYPPDHGELAPLVFESGGRPSDEAVAFIRGYGHGLAPAEKTDALSTVWRHLSRTLQTGNAEMLLSAIR